MRVLLSIVSHVGFQGQALAYKTLRMNHMYFVFVRSTKYLSTSITRMYYFVPGTYPQTHQSATPASAHLAASGLAPLQALFSVATHEKELGTINRPATFNTKSRRNALHHFAESPSLPRVRVVKDNQDKTANMSYQKHDKDHGEAPVRDPKLQTCVSLSSATTDRAQDKEE